MPDPLKEISNLGVLKYRLYNEPALHDHHFDDLSATDLLNTLYACLWGEDIKYFIRNPELHPKEADWHRVDNQGKRWSLAATQKKESEAWNRQNIRKGKICGNYLARGDRCFNCKTCAVDNTSVLCSECFFASDHDGHDVTYGVAYSFSGYCDCGDPSSWSRPTGCSHHPPADNLLEPSSSNLVNPPRHVDLPIKRTAAIRATLETVLDFIIQTFEAGPLEANVAIPRTVEEVILETQGAQLTKGKIKLKQVSLIIWADEKHTAKEIVRQISHATGFPTIEAKRLLKILEREGRVIVLSTDDYHRLIHVAQTLAQIDLIVTLQLSSDAYREQACGVIIPWLADVCDSQILDDDLLLRRRVGDALLIPSKTKAEGQEDQYRDTASRMERLFLVFSRFWRAPRISWMKIFVKILTADMDYKIALGNTFARMYTYLVDQYLFFDRESDLSLLLWGMQLFPVPAIATAAVRDMDILHTLLQVLTSYFTEQYEQQHLRIPPLVVPRIDANVESFRTKKWQTPFGHLKVILQSKGVQRILLMQPEAFNEVVSFLSLFTAMVPQLRITTEHIEFETDAWIRALTVSMDLSRITISLGQALDRANKERLVRAIVEIGLHISYNCRLLSTVLDSDKFACPTRHKVHLFGREFEVIAHDPEVEFVSIHNPLHWTLAEAIKRLSTCIERESKEGGGEEKTSRKDIASWVTASNRDSDDSLIDFNMQITLENPLRTVVFLSQVRAGLWVRNGIGMRGQLFHYRDNPLRETTYDQDLFLLQFGFSMLDPGTMLAGVIDRFMLRQHFTTANWANTLETAHELQLIEELLLLLITVFSETWAMFNHSRKDSTRREIIHILCLGQLPFSDISKRLSERTVEISTFKEILEEVATLRIPQGVTETGVYELKDQFFDQVNPLYFHYTRNQQNSAYEILCKRRKKDVLPVSAPAILPGLPFSQLLNIFETPYIVATIHIVMHNIIRIRNRDMTTPTAPTVPQLDGIIDLCFHLATLALSCASETTARLFCETNEVMGYAPLLEELCAIELDKNWTPYQPRISNIIESIALHHGDKVRKHRTQHSPSQTVSADDARKAAVEKRKKAIMAGFAKNQVAFAQAYSVDDESDEEDQDEVISFGQCIVCQESCSPGRASGLLAMAQPSKVLRNMCVGRDWLEECLRAPETLDQNTRTSRFGFGTDHHPSTTDAYPRSDQRLGINVAVCGHLMHEDCLAKFFNDTYTRQQQQSQRNHPENVFRKEYVCPLCKSVSNVLVPLTIKEDTASNVAYMPLNDWIRRTLDEDLRRHGDQGSPNSRQHFGGEKLVWLAQGGQEAHMDSLDDGDSKILTRYNGVVQAISEQTSHIHGRVEYGLYVPKDVVGYTLSIMEISQRGIASTQETSSYLSEPSERLLRGLLTLLVQDARSKTPVSKKDPVANRISVFSSLLPERFRTKPTSSALLLREPLTIVIETAVDAIDALQPVIVLCYYAEVIRAMLGITFWARLCLSRAPSPIWSEPGADAAEYGLATAMFPRPRTLILSCFRHTPQLLQEATSALNLLSERDLSKLIYTFTLPFLRRCSMLCSALKISTMGSYSPADSTLGEYEKHLQYLQIPLPDACLLDPHQPIASTVVSWLKQWIHLDTSVPTLEYPGIYELYRLPETLQMTLRAFEKKECEKCHRIPSNAAVCLFCGHYICLGTDCCAEGSLGEANLHRMECGAAVGLFLDITRWAMVYLYAGSGSFGPTPFLDCHGELDQGMRRGHPQSQHRARAEHLRRAWLGHGVPSFVARRLELTLDQNGWDSL